MALELNQPDEAAYVAAEADRLHAMRDARQFLIDRAATEEESYLDKSRAAATALDELFARTNDLADLASTAPTPINIELARFLAVAAPISSDDLKLVTFGLAKRERLEAQLAFIAQHLDPLCFPWLREGRPATDEERHAAIAATAGIYARQQGSTDRRMVLGRLNEGATAAVIEAAGYTRGEWPLLPGQYRGEMSIDGTKADLLVRLWDSRLLLIECKASLSEVNSYKRVGLEVAAKPAKWEKALGDEVIVPAAVLAGAISNKTIQRILDSGVLLAWQHNLAALQQVLDANRCA